MHSTKGDKCHFKLETLGPLRSRPDCYGGQGLQRGANLLHVGFRLNSTTRIRGPILKGPRINNPVSVLRRAFKNPTKISIVWKYMFSVCLPIYVLPCTNIWQQCRRMRLKTTTTLIHNWYVVIIPAFIVLPFKHNWGLLLSFMSSSFKWKYTVI